MADVRVPVMSIHRHAQEEYNHQETHNRETDGQFDLSQLVRSLLLPLLFFLDNSCPGDGSQRAGIALPFKEDGICHTLNTLVMAAWRFTFFTFHTVL